MRVLRLPKVKNPNRMWALVIGAGLALSPIHNLWLTKAVTSGEGEVGFFLPAFGTAMWLMATLVLVSENWKKLDWGDKRVYVPLLVIAGAIGLSGITAPTLGGKFAPLFMGLSLFSLYLVARKLGKDMFLPLAVGAAVASLGILVHGMLYPGRTTGGFVFEGNFDIATGYILLGAALFIHRYQWILALLAVVALLVSGAPEALFVLAVLTIVVLVRRDWSRKLVAVLSAVVILVGVGLVSGYGDKLYTYTADTLGGAPVANYQSLSGEEANVSPLGIRWLVIQDAMSNIRVLGEGYNVTNFTVHTVHNVPLVIVQQLGWAGILAGLAWLWVSVWCLVKTRWKYVWVAMLALGLFDHFIWSQLGPWFWAVVGASTASVVKSDMIFKKEAA